jgi:hypothetical protein
MLAVLNKLLFGFDFCHDNQVCFLNRQRVRLLLCREVGSEVHPVAQILN